MVICWDASVLFVGLDNEFTQSALVGRPRLQRPRLHRWTTSSDSTDSELSVEQWTRELEYHSADHENSGLRYRVLPLVGINDIISWLGSSTAFGIIVLCFATIIA
jgi:hypothetical protein